MNPILQSRPWMTAPQFPAPIDRSNPITKGLIFAAEPGGWGHKYVLPRLGGASPGALGSGVTLGPRTGTVAGNAIRQPMATGRLFNYSGSQANGSHSFGLFAGLVGATQATWQLRFYGAANPLGHIFGQWDSNLYWLIQLTASGNFLAVVADDQSGNRTRYDSNSGPFASAGWHEIFVSWRGGNHLGANRSVMADGQFLVGGLNLQDTSVNANNIDNRTPSADNLQLGIVSGGTAFTGAIAFARIWNRGISDAEMLSLHRRPYQIFRPLSRVIVGAPSSAAVYMPHSLKLNRAVPRAANW